LQLNASQENRGGGEERSGHAGALARRSRADAARSTARWHCRGGVQMLVLAALTGALGLIAGAGLAAAMAGL
jgi:hypothetical protein